MTSTLRAKSNGDGRAVREAAVAPRQPSTESMRRWGRIGAGLGAAVIGAWLFAALYLSAGDRTEVVVVAERVERLSTIERSDLRTARISDDVDVTTVAADRLEELVGRVAGVELVPGSLLAEGQLLPSDHQLLDASEAVVGVLLGPGDGPGVSLRRGAPVLVVVRPPPAVPGEPVAIEGWVFDASADAVSARERPIDVVVPRVEAASVSAAAAEGRVTIVALSE